MKRIVTLSVLVIALFSCEKYDDSAIWDYLVKEKELEKGIVLCNKLNTNALSLSMLVSAMHDEDYVKEVVKIMENGKEVGYTLSFHDNGQVAIYDTLDTDMDFPVVGIKKDPYNEYCWTLDGMWLISGKDTFKVISDESENCQYPALKSESGVWYVSLDGEKSWEPVYRDDSFSVEGSCFRSIDLGEESVSITLIGGEEIAFPLWTEREPWGGYLDPDVYDEQDILNLTNVLMANMNNCNLATRHIMEIAYGFWKRRNEFIYSSKTAQDLAWDYWTYVGFKDSNTGFVVEEGHGGYKRIDCSTFVHYIINGIDYYSTPYFNALEWTEVSQGALTTGGTETSSADKTVCRTGKMYLRHGKKHVVESANSNNYRFTKILAYNSAGKVIQNLTGKTSFRLDVGVSYVRAEMKVQSTANYSPAIAGEKPASILRCLRIREGEELPVNAECPMSNRYTHNICRWFDDNGYGLEAYEDYNPLAWEDSDFEPGTVIFMGKTSSSSYKGITHMALYIGGGYIIHSQAPRGLLGGEGIMIDKLRDMEYRYSRPFCAAASPEYHSDFSEEISNQQ